MALERIGGVLAPELHVLIGALLDAAVAVVHVALQPADDVGHRHVEPLALASRRAPACSPSSRTTVALPSPPSASLWRHWDACRPIRSVGRAPSQDARTRSRLSCRR